jgi:hypothetical protein
MTRHVDDQMRQLVDRLAEQVDPTGVLPQVRRRLERRRLVLRVQTAAAPGACSAGRRSVRAVAGAGTWSPARTPSASSPSSRRPPRARAPKRSASTSTWLATRPPVARAGTTSASGTAGWRPPERARNRRPASTKTSLSQRLRERQRWPGLAAVHVSLGAEVGGRPGRAGGSPASGRGGRRGSTAGRPGHDRAGPPRRRPTATGTVPPSCRLPAARSSRAIAAPAAPDPAHSRQSRSTSRGLGQSLLNLPGQRPTEVIRSTTAVRLNTGARESFE